ncbi:MAG: hypothetical protein ABGZ17_10740, partial [Planctomycetaceae bacterium]
ELIGAITSDEQQRWETIKRTFQQNTQMRGVAPDDKVGQVVVQLRQFSDGLHHIHSAMVGGFEKLADMSPSDATIDEKVVAPAELENSDSLELVHTTVSALRDSLEGIRQAVSQMGPNLAEVGTAIGEALSTAPSLPSIDRSPSTPLEESVNAMVNIRHPDESQGVPAPIKTASDGSQKITVINKLPRSFLRVLDSQFELMQNWMKPILESSQHQSAQMADLQSSLESCLQTYQRLVKKLKSDSDGRG